MDYDASGGELLDVVMRYFRDGNWRVEMHDTMQVVRVPYKGSSGTWTCFARVVDDEQVVFLSVYPDHVPEKRRSAMAEFLVRATFGMNVGAFEMDFADGEVRFRVGLDVSGDRLTTVLFSSMVHIATEMMDAYFAGIKAVINGTSPQEAIALIEEDEDDEDDDNFDEEDDA